MDGGRAATGARRDAVDVARVLALVVVVLGHLVLAVVDRGPDGALRGANILELHPGWSWLAALAPMPVFFAAGGWANATATPAAAAPRVRALGGLGAVVVGAWSAAVLVAAAVAGDPGVVADGARVASQPLWFLAAYVPFAVAGGPLARVAARHPVRAIGGCLAFVAVLDLGRFGLGGPRWLGWPGFPAAWAVPWLAGAWWRDRCTRGDRFGERRAGLLVALGAGAVAAGLVLTAGYQPSLIDAVPGKRSNTTPPSLYTAVAALAQSGLLLAGAGALDRVGRRWRRLRDRAGEAAVAVYLWHLSALALCVALVAAGAPAPRRLTAAWWLTRPLWWAAVLALTGAFVAATAAARARLARRSGRPVARGTPATLAGVAVTAATAATVGLEGPKTPVLAVACTTGFAAGWLLLGRRPVRPGPAPPGNRARTPR